MPKLDEAFPPFGARVGGRPVTDLAPPSLASLVRQRPVQIALAIALVVRLTFLLIPQLPHYTPDSMSYVEPGVNLFSQGTFAMTCEPRCVPTLLRTPGYPLLVGLVVGPLGLPLTAIYVLQALADTMTTLLVAAVGWTIGGRKTAICAAFIQALDPFSAVFAAQVMTESVATLALMGGLYLLFRLRPAGSGRATLGWAALGMVLGFATLVRPVFALIPAIFAVAMFDRQRWREQLFRWTIASVGFTALVAPWVVRNWSVTRDGRADDSFQVLASVAVPRYRSLMTPGLMRWYQSFEEPFIWDRLTEVPAVARYLLPGEKERTQDLFIGVRAANLMITPELDAGFAQLARDRIEAHPFRARVLPPITRAARLWITPRLAAFGVESARISGLMGKFAFFAATAFNASLALCGFFAGLVRFRSERCRLLLAVPLYLTLVHAVIMWGNQSRYVVPAFPEIAILASVGGLSFIDYLRRMRAPSDQRHHEASRIEVL